LITTPVAIKAARSANLICRAEFGTVGRPLLAEPPAAIRAARSANFTWRLEFGFEGRPGRAFVVCTVSTVFGITFIFYFFIELNIHVLF
jgi:hypothetical protein